MKAVVKIYGEKRTGTCWTALLLEHNFKVKVLQSQLGGKHWPAVDFEKYREFATKMYTGEGLHRLHLAPFFAQQRFVLCVKDPYATILSIIAHEQRWGVHRIEDAFFYEMLALRLNFHYQSWLDFGEGRERFVVVVYEKTLRDPVATIRDVGNVLGLTAREGAFDTVPQEVRAGGSLHDGFSERQERGPTYYLERQYIREFSPYHLDLVTSRINWDIFGTFGYKPEPLTGALSASEDIMPRGMRSTRKRV